MSLDIGTLVGRLVLDDKPYDRGLKDSAARGERAGRDTGLRWRRAFAGPVAAVGKTAAAFFAVDQVVGFFKDSISEARESQKVNALTAQVIKSTGGAANLTAVQVGNLATAISNKTGIDDETIQSGESLLLTFKNVRNEAGRGNDVFSQATGIMTDMSVALGQDTKSSAIQLGKALGDPIKGVTALQRVGVSFTESQKKQIKTLVEGGHTLGAQKIILKELRSEFGGAAAAAATPAQRLAVVWGNVKEAIGTKLLPVLDTIATVIMSRVIPAAGGLYRWLAPIATRVVGALVAEGRRLLPTLVGIGAGFLSVARSIGSGAFRVGVALWTALRPLLISARDTLQRVVPPTLAWARVMGGGLASALRSVAGFIGDNKTLVQTLAVGILAVVGAVKAWTLATAIWSGITRAAAAAQAVLNAVMAANPIALVVLAVVGLAAAFIYAYRHSETFRAVVQTALHDVQAVAGAVVGWFSGSFIPFFTQTIPGAFRAVLGFVRQWGPLILTALLPVIGAPLLIWQHWSTIKEKIVGAFKGALSWLVNAGKSVVSGFVTGVSMELSGVVTIGKAIGTHVLSPMANAATWLLNAGKHVVTGFVTGISNTLSSVTGWAKTVIAYTLNPFARASTWLVDEGRSVVTGLVTGISQRVSSAGAWGKTLAATVTNKFMNAGSWLVSRGWSIVSGLVSGISQRVSSAGAWGKTLGASVTNKFANAGKWLLGAGGNIVSGLKSGIAAAITGIGSWIKKNFVDPIVGFVKQHFGIHSPSTVMAGIGTHMVSGLMKGLATAHPQAIARTIFGDLPHALAGMLQHGLISASHLPAKATQALGALGGTIMDKLGDLGIDLGITDSKGGHGSYGGSNRTLAKLIAQSFGWGSGAEWRAFDALEMSEAGYNENAQNPTSTAYGMGQFLDSTWAAFGPKTSNPFKQLLYMMRYIGGRFGDPIRAWAFHRAHNYYATGGVTPGGRVWVGEHGKELADLPRGTRIHSTGQSHMMAASGSLDMASSQAIADAVGRAVASYMDGATLRIEGDGLARIVNTQNRRLERLR